MPALGLTSPLPLTSDGERVKAGPGPRSRPYSVVGRDGSTAALRSLVGKPRSLKRETISGLSDSLNFDGDVVSSRCPETIPYSEAKQDLQSLLRPMAMHFGGRRHATLPETGRCDMRGETKKHRTCSIRRSRTSSSVFSRRDGHAEELKTSACPHKDNQALPVLKRQSKMGIVRSMSDSNISSYPSLGRLSLVEKWQVAALASVSMETAETFVDKVRGSDKRRLEEFLQQKNNFESGHVQASTVEVSKALTSKSSLPSPLLQHNGSLVQGMAIPTKDYLTELRLGAVPIRQNANHVAKDSITLSNNSRFNKVLQPAFPPMPTSWLESSMRDDKKGSRTSKSVKGYRKWKELPVRAPVSDTCMKIEHAFAVVLVAGAMLL